MKCEQTRNSGIDLLRLLAMGLIVLSHAMPSGIQGGPVYGISTDNWQRFLITVLGAGGHLGNGIFVVASAWFLVGSSHVRFQKIARIAADCWVVSALFLLAFLLGGKTFSGGEVLRQLFPLTVSANWFVGCYLLFYAIHPALNLVGERLTKNQHLILSLTLAVLYSGIQMLRAGAFYYNELIGFICVYFYLSYLKRYRMDWMEDRRKNRRLLALGFGCWLGYMLIVNLLGLKIGWFSNKMCRMNAFISPFVMMIAIPALNLFRGLGISGRKITALSRLTLLIYVIHNNQLLRSTLVPRVYRYLYGSFSARWELARVLLTGLGLGILGVGLAILYSRTLQRPVYRAVDRICGRIGKGLGPWLEGK